MKTKKIFLLIAVFILSLAFTNVQAQKRQAVKKSRKSVHVNSYRKSDVVRPSNRSYQALPKASVNINHKGENFHYYNGSYYRRDDKRYVHVAAPVGLRLNVLSGDYARVSFNRKSYCVHNGVYYLEFRNGPNVFYEVVRAPMGAVVYDLPWNMERVRINGRIYFESNFVIYEKIRSSQGIAYKVVGHIGY